MAEPRRERQTPTQSVVLPYEKTTGSEAIALYNETNPSLDTILTERKILDEIGSDPVDFNIQCLGVWVQPEGREEQLLPADSVILSAGMKPRTAIVDELQKATVPEVYTIGDCAAARKMGDAIREGYYTAINL